MHILTFASPQSLVDKSSTIKNRFVIVIDALRATSVITTALAAGARGVIPVASVEDAMKLYHTLGTDYALLCGEREGRPIPGFHLGNSPLEYDKLSVGGRMLVMTTTNGTRALLAAANAGVLVAGCMLNASAVAFAARDSGLDVTLLCAGTRGRFSLDDVLAAGAIIHSLGGVQNELDDLSQVALSIYEKHQDNPLEGLRNCAHAQYLDEAGYFEDVRFCMRPDGLNVVPFYEKGMMKL